MLPAAKTTSPRANSQPLEAANNPDALLKIQTVVALAGSSQSTIYRLILAGEFPAPVRMGARCTRWRAGTVTAWLQKVAEI